MLTRFNMVRDINGYNGFGLVFSNAQFQTVLVADVESTLSVPTTKDATYSNLLAVFSFFPGSSVWVSLNGDSTTPVPGSFDECQCELNPSARFVKFGDVLRFTTTQTDVQIGVSFYAIT